MYLKNTTTLPPAQLPNLSPISFGPEYSHMFAINGDVDLVQGLGIATDLADGISQLCDRLHDAINGGEVALCSEVRALGFLGDVVSAITRSAQLSLSKAAEARSAQ